MRMEIDADELHEWLLLWKQGTRNKPLVYHAFKAVVNGAVSILIVSPYLNPCSLRFRMKARALDPSL